MFFPARKLQACISGSRCVGSNILELEAGYFSFPDARLNLQWFWLDLFFQKVRKLVSYGSIYVDMFQNPRMLLFEGKQVYSFKVVEQTMIWSQLDR